MRRIATFLALATATISLTGCGCFRRGASHTAAMPVTTGCAVCGDTCGCGDYGVGGPMMVEGPVFSTMGQPQVVETMPAPQ